VSFYFANLATPIVSWPLQRKLKAVKPCDFSHALTFVRASSKIRR
jgi:hypothetical protein